MKRILTATILIIMITMTLLSAPSVVAETKSYYYVTDNTTMMIDDSGKTLQGTVNIPKTWYVKASGSTDIKEGDITYKIVEYNGVIGKVDASKLSAKTIPLAAAPYFTSEIMDIKTSDEFPLSVYNDAGCRGSAPFTIDEGSNINYLAGTNSKTYLISCNLAGVIKYGFVKKASLVGVADITPIENPNNKNPDTPSVGGDDDLAPPGKDKNKGDKEPINVLRTALIVAICVLAVLIVFLIFKPSKKKRPHDDYYDDYKP